MPKFIEFVSDEEQISARAVLLEDQAPKTCALVWDFLPVSAFFHHAMYSGPELVMFLPQVYDMEQENATCVYLPWEIGFATLRAKDFIDVKQDFSEIMFFYDRNTGPKMLEGLVKVNLFARFVTGQDALFELAHRVQNEGRKAFTVRRVAE